MRPDGLLLSGRAAEGCTAEGCPAEGCAAEGCSAAASANSTRLGPPLGDSVALALGEFPCISKLHSSCTQAASAGMLQETVLQ